VRILLVADGPPDRGGLRKLLAGAPHEVGTLRLDAGAALMRGDWDMVVLDADARDASAQARLLDAAQASRRNAPHTPIVVMSSFEPGTGVRRDGREGCALTECGGGVWEVRCRLKQLAWRETEALLREAIERDVLEPVAFEYQGEVGS